MGLLTDIERAKLKRLVGIQDPQPLASSMNDTERARLLQMIEKQRGGLQEPWIDPVTAGAGGFGGAIPSTLRALAAKTGLKALARPVVAGLTGAAADYPLGKATEVVEDVSPALAMPFNIAAGMGSGALANKAVEVGANAMKLRSMGMLPPIKNPAVNEAGMVEAWHGSPHKFDRFDSSKIGTGEGAQAFGHGLYFTDKEEIARHYARKMLPEPRYGEHYDADIDEGYRVLDSSGKVAKDKNGERLVFSNEKDAKDYIRDYKMKGNLYKVTINKGRDDVWLDWDKPVEDETIEKVVTAINKEKLGFAPRDPNWTVEEFTDKIYAQPGEAKNNVLYHYLSERIAGSPKEASLFLKRAGIDGIRYPTESLSGPNPQVSQIKRDLKSIWSRLGDNSFNNFDKIRLISEAEKGSKKAEKTIRKALGEYTQGLDDLLEAVKNRKFNYVVFDENAVEIDDKISY